jgi:pyruvate dehydrogenase E2 component (dihydrolipoamide acetyltransferase)
VSEFVMPSLGPDMEAGTLVEWLKKPGDAVKRGDVMAVVETQKGAIEIEIFEAGVLDRILVQPGEQVPVGTALATLRTDGAVQEPEPAPPQPEAPPEPEAPEHAAEKPPIEIPELEAKADVRVRISPAARRRAADLGVNLAGVRGSGPEGSVGLADVEAVARAASAARAAEPPRRATFDPTAMRKAIAAAMARSKREIPHYYLTQTVDLHRALTWLEGANRERPPTERLLPAVLFLKGTALALRKVPELNGFWHEDGYRAGAGVHVGWAIALRGGGLIAPAIHDADQKSLADLMAALRELVQRARTGGLRSSELADPTITVTSLGERGAETVIGVIYPPQVAIVGFGRIVERPWAVDDALAVRPVVSLSLAADHRASDGHRGGLLLTEIERLLQEPEALPKPNCARLFWTPWATSLRKRTLARCRRTATSARSWTSTRWTSSISSSRCTKSLGSTSPKPTTPGL